MNYNLSDGDLIVLPSKVLPNLPQIVLSVTENSDVFNVENKKVEITIFSEKVGASSLPLSKKSPSSLKWCDLFLALAIPEKRHHEIFFDRIVHQRFLSHNMTTTTNNREKGLETLVEFSRGKRFPLDNLANTKHDL